MPYENAKTLLDQAGSPTERERAIEAAMSLGMPLNEIESYLDWLDSSRGTSEHTTAPESSDSDQSTDHDAG